MKQFPQIFLALALFLSISLLAPQTAACFRDAAIFGAMNGRAALSDLGLFTHTASFAALAQNSDSNQNTVEKELREQQRQNEEQERRLEQQRRDRAERDQQRNNCQAQAQAEYENCRANNPNGSCQIANCE